MTNLERSIEWLSQCADRLMKKGGLGSREANEMAIHIKDFAVETEGRYGVYKTDPIAWADEEMDCWH